MQPLPIFKTLGFTFKRTLLNGGDLVWLFAKYIGAILLTVGLTIGSCMMLMPSGGFLQIKESFGNLSLGGIEHTTSTLMGTLLSSGAAPMVILCLIGISIFILFAMNTARLITLKVLGHEWGNEGFFKSSFGGKNFMYGLQMLKIVLVYLLIMALIGSVVFGIEFFLPTQEWLFVVSLILGVLAFLYISLRFSVFGAVAALDLPASLDKAWNLGKGQALRFLGFWVLFGLSFAAIYLLPTMLLSGIGLMGNNAILGIFSIVLTLALSLFNAYLLGTAYTVAIAGAYKGITEK